MKINYKNILSVLLFIILGFFLCPWIMWALFICIKICIKYNIYPSNDLLYTVLISCCPFFAYLSYKGIRFHVRNINSGIIQKWIVPVLVFSINISVTYICLINILEVFR